MKKFKVQINREASEAVVLKEFTNLIEGFEYFKKTDLNELQKETRDTGYELVKYQNEELVDWENEELDSIGWEKGSWVVKNKEGNYEWNKYLENK